MLRLISVLSRAEILQYRRRINKKITRVKIWNQFVNNNKWLVRSVFGTEAFSKRSISLIELPDLYQLIDIRWSADITSHNRDRWLAPNNPNRTTPNFNQLVSWSPRKPSTTPYFVKVSFELMSSILSWCLLYRRAKPLLDKPDISARALLSDALMHLAEPPSLSVNALTVIYKFQNTLDI